jgi:glycosyltransferase involved in cell wall biosynthesis
MIPGSLRIVFCTDGIFPHAVGGMQRHSKLLIEELAKDERIQLTVIHPHHGKQIFNDHHSIKEIGIDQGKSSGIYLIDCYNYSKQVYKILQEYKDALIYSQGLSVWYKINRIGKRVIINPHGLEPYQTISIKDKLISTPFRIIFGYLFKKSAAVVSLGGRLTDILGNLRSLNKNKIIVLPNAVNIPEQQMRSYNNHPVKFLFVGRFAFNKGIGVLLEVAEKLNLEGFEDKMIFNLVGKGPLFEEYKKAYSAPNIHFIGFADDDKLIDLYKENDVFVLPTLFEGMPTVVLEAMTYSMPVIVTDVGATLELVNSSNGFIIEKNDPESLKEALLKFYHLTGVERKSLSEQSYLKVKDNFTWPVVTGKYKDLFFRLKKNM